MNRRVMLGLVCVCAMPSLAAAQDDAFKQGLQARSDKKWADVVRHMQNALKADAQESTRKVGSRLGVGGTSIYRTSSSARPTTTSRTAAVR